MNHVEHTPKEVPKVFELIYNLVVGLAKVFEIVALPCAVVSVVLRLRFNDVDGSIFQNKSLWKHSPMSHAALFFALGGSLMLLTPNAGPWFGFLLVLTGFIDWYCQIVYVLRARQLE